ncbi:MAG TPA: hypothetical protein VMH85_22465 [Terriglobales bacterium]|nr:hypothetical protein [Terriglobales bacterium]
MVMTLGPPIAVLFCTATYYSYRARSDWRLIALSLVAAVMIAEWFVAIEPRLLSILLDGLYIALTVFFTVRWRVQTRQKAG